MIDEEIKKVIIKNQDLPPFQFTTVYNEITEREEIDQLHYDFRYRIVSEDKNRYSHWSPIIRYPMPDITFIFPYTSSTRISITKSGNNPEIITAIWTKPGIADEQTPFEKIINNISTYDVWLRWNANNTTDLDDLGWSEWEYVSTTTANNFSIAKRDDSDKRVEVAVQATTSLKIRDYNNNKLTMFTALSGTI
jgi:hypothetical protein